MSHYVAKWEFIEQNDFDSTYRMIVPGGWIVKVMCTNITSSYSTKQAEAVSMMFVKDNNHKWVIK